MGVYNFAVKRGETFDRTLIWWTVLNVTARDITGYSFALQVRDKPGGTLLLSLATGSGITIVNGPAGQFRMVAAAATTAALTFFKAPYDLKATAPSGTVSYPLEGYFITDVPVTP